MGNQLLKDGYGYFQQLHRDADVSHEKTYLFDYYDVAAKSHQILIKAVSWKKIRSAVIYAINEVTRMPKLIILCFDINNAERDGI